MNSESTTEKRGVRRRVAGVIVGLCAVLAVVIGVLFATGVLPRAEQSAPADTVAMPSVVPPSSTGGVVPATIAIPSLQVSARVEPKGTVMEYAKFLGRDVPSFGVPTDMMDTTWWSDGPRPGSDGMAVILGHTQVGGPGVFNDISRMRNGDTIVVTAASGEAVEFSVTRVVADIPKSDPSALNKALTSAPKGSGIALVTCGGRFDSAVDASVDNIVVFAEPRRG